MGKGGAIMIYFDNAATTMRKPDCVIDAVADAMRNFGNSGRGAHEASLDASRMIYLTWAIRCRLHLPVIPLKA